METAEYEFTIGGVEVLVRMPEGVPAPANVSVTLEAPDEEGFLEIAAALGGVETLTLPQKPEVWRQHAFRREDEAVVLVGEPWPRAGEPPEPAAVPHPFFAGVAPEPGA